MQICCKICPGGISTKMQKSLPAEIRENSGKTMQKHAREGFLHFCRNSFLEGTSAFLQASVPGGAREGCPHFYRNPSLEMRGRDFCIFAEIRSGADFCSFTEIRSREKINSFCIFANMRWMNTLLFCLVNHFLMGLFNCLRIYVRLNFLVFLRWFLLDVFGFVFWS